MSFKRLWEENIIGAILVWLVFSVLARPGWLTVGGGVLIWFFLLYFTAPGIFWNLIALFNLNPEKREDLLNKALSYRPASPRPDINLAILKARQKKWPEAARLFEEAREKPGKQLAPRFQNLLSVCYREAGEDEKALALLDKLLKDGYSHGAVYLNQAFIHFKVGRLAEALTAAKKARALNISAVEPVLLLGKIHFALEDYQAAKDDYEWSIANTSWPVESYYWLGRSELALGLLDEAVSHLETAVQRITEDPLLSDVPVNEAQEWLEKARALKTEQTAD
ncbi:MAG: tetratricopeptide repeat protein [Firmicutes bacterium]|nr:tetratricopeptide repeat protein [Bacillota bacterium]